MEQEIQNQVSFLIGKYGWLFLVGILNFERGRISRKFPFLEPYIDHFFESLEIFKILILDFFR